MNQPIWAPDKLAKTLLLKNLFSKKYLNFKFEKFDSTQFNSWTKKSDKIIELEFSSSFEWARVIKWNLDKNKNILTYLLGGQAWWKQLEVKMLLDCLFKLIIYSFLLT